MAIYAIGDIQGCFDSLMALLSRIQPDDGDELWLCGDLVNRGPRSLDVLRWARSRSHRVRAVLGNHDLHLLARVAGVTKRRKRDTLSDILDAPDCEDLIDWLRAQPFVLRRADRVMVHAGLHPQWSFDDAVDYADELSQRLQSKRWRERVAELYTRQPPAWKPSLGRRERRRAAAGVLLRARAMNRRGELCHDFAGPPGRAPSGYFPWFKAPDARWRGEGYVVFGHWSALGLTTSAHHISLDTGCVWGRALTAVRLDDRAVFQVDACDARASSS